MNREVQVLQVGFAIMAVAVVMLMSISIFTMFTTPRNTIPEWQVPQYRFAFEFKEKLEQLMDEVCATEANITTATSSQERTNMQLQAIILKDTYARMGTAYWLEHREFFGRNKLAPREVMRSAPPFEQAKLQYCRSR